MRDWFDTGQKGEFMERRGGAWEGEFQKNRAQSHLRGALTETAGHAISDDPCWQLLGGKVNNQYTRWMIRQARKEFLVRSAGGEIGFAGTIVHCNHSAWHRHTGTETIEWQRNCWARLWEPGTPMPPLIIRTLLGQVPIMTS